MSIDQSLFDFAKEKLVSDIYQQLPNKNAPGEMGVVRREMNKKREGRLFLIYNKVGHPLISKV